VEAVAQAIQPRMAALHQVEGSRHGAGLEPLPIDTEGDTGPIGPVDEDFVPDGPSLEDCHLRPYLPVK
jgi:hypothetical protein